MYHGTNVQAVTTENSVAVISSSITYTRITITHRVRDLKTFEHVLSCATPEYMCACNTCDE